MNGNKAKLKYNPSNFEILEEGDYVVCAVSGKNIPLNVAAKLEVVIDKKTKIIKILIFYLILHTSVGLLLAKNMLLVNQHSNRLTV